MARAFPKLANFSFCFFQYDARKNPKNDPPLWTRGVNKLIRIKNALWDSPANLKATSFAFVFFFLPF